MQGDLRPLPEHLGTFDVVLSWGNSFGYITPAETQGSLTGSGEVKPGGRLILESLTVAEGFLTRPSARAQLHVRRHHDGRDQPYNPLKSRLESDWVFTDSDGHEERASGAHHVHTTGEVVRMLHAAGFERIALKGPDGAREYALGDRRMIAVAGA